jgi:hypothetical protein
MKALRGMSFIDVVVGTSVMLMIFLSIFGAYILAIDLVLNTKARVGGQALVAQEIEYIRGLSYQSLGTVGGIPQGPLPQVSTTTLNNIAYTKRILIKYIDDPADGFGAADTNRITADYKEVKVEVSWVIRQRLSSTFALTRIAPQGIESLTAGGTLRVNVFDALAAPIQGAQVRILNASTSPAIDITVSTDATGSVAFPGAPPASNYRITVTKDGYSSARTYDITAQNPNPNPGHVSVANQQTTTASFAIDRVSALTIRTRSPVAAQAYQDTFTSGGQLATSSQVVPISGSLRLFDGGAGYSLSGSAQSLGVSPTELVGWDTVSWTSVMPTSTTVAVQVVYPDGALWSPIPDGVLPGNSAGLTTGSVSLALVSTSTYPTLGLRALLGTADASSTPALNDWRIDYRAGPSPIPNVGFTAYGTKTIGTTISGAPIYKVVLNQTTDSAGVFSTSTLEWDSYLLSLTGSSYSIAEECPTPISVPPQAAADITLLLVPQTTHSLRVIATASNTLLPGATVTVTSPGNVARTTSPCGQAFFSGLTSDTYTVTVTHPNYQTSQQEVSVAGGTVVTIPLIP